MKASHKILFALLAGTLMVSTASSSSVVMAAHQASAGSDGMAAKPTVTPFKCAKGQADNLSLVACPSAPGDGLMGFRFAGVSESDRNCWRRDAGC